MSFSEMGSALGSVADNFMSGIIGFLNGVIPKPIFPGSSTGNEDQPDSVWSQLPENGEDDMSISTAPTTATPGNSGTISDANAAFEAMKAKTTEFLNGTMDSQAGNANAKKVQL